MACAYIRGRDEAIHGVSKSHEFCVQKRGILY